tara:strand:- start:3209 stop:3328 length:120 start_codon:yes stop_codon:yes gene_type:complete
MNKKDAERFRKVDGLWDEEFEEELGLVYADDAMDDFKNK